MARTQITLPYEASRAVQALGQNLRTARLRRNMTLEEVAGRIGVHRETLAMAEKGNPNVSMGTYVGALWVLGLTNDLLAVADPERDRVGQSLESRRERARTPQGLSNDF